MVDHLQIYAYTTVELQIQIYYEQLLPVSCHCIVTSGQLSLQLLLQSAILRHIHMSFYAQIQIQLLVTGKLSYPRLADWLLVAGSISNISFSYLDYDNTYLLFYYVKMLTILYPISYIIPVKPVISQSCNLCTTNIITSYLIYNYKQNL